jgi:choice-of-anchor A domain-containing protein
VNYNGGGGLVSSGPPNPLTTYTTPLAQLSTTLNGLATTAGDSVSSQSNALTFNALAAGINVFTLTASQLSADMSNTSIYFNIAAGATSVIINVDGTGTFQESGGVNWNGSPLEDVLFNFVGFSSVSVGNWQSSILAPGAAVSIENGYIAGSVFAASFNGGGELHNDPFDGALPSDPPADPPSTTVPEPMSVLMLGTGLAGLALVLWRRPRRVAARA